MTVVSGLFQKSFGFDWDSSRSEEYNLNVLVNQLKSGQLVYNQQQAIDYINNLPNDDQHWNSFEDTQKLIQAGAISTLFSVGIFELENGRILFKGPSNTAITAGKNFKEHFIRHKNLLEDITGKKYPKFKTHGQEFLDDLGNVIKEGKVVYEGIGTIKKDFPPCKIYRGNGVTVILKENNEFITMIKSGEGMDLAIQMIK